VSFPKLKAHQGHSFYKLGLRKALAISVISISVFLDVDDGGRYLLPCCQRGFRAVSLTGNGDRRNIEEQDVG